ncbi:hypothetical protein, partial [Clostridium sp. ZBS17]|uniref:hypothetical protein n=1 Tax=Clostridium sp. ZBS17 TaxID=2949968 RepID=UPI00207ABD59
MWEGVCWRIIFGDFLKVYPINKNSGVILDDLRFIDPIYLLFCIIFIQFATIDPLQWRIIVII